jgi:hypothetical protein
LPGVGVARDASHHPLAIPYLDALVLRLELQKHCRFHDHLGIVRALEILDGKI